MHQGLESTHGDCKAGCHSVEVVGVLSHGHDLGNNRALGPFDSENLGQLSQVGGSGLTNGEDGITKPPHAKVTKLLIEELNAQLAGKQGDIFDDGKTDSPLLVLGQLDNCGKKRLRQKINADNYNSQRYGSCCLKCRFPYPY